MRLIPDEADPAATEWPWVTLGDLFDIQQGKALSQTARRGVSPRLFLRTSNVHWGRLSLDALDEMDFSASEAARYELQPGDLLVCEGGEIGRTAIWNGELLDCHYQNHLHRCRALVPDVDPTFYMYWLQYAFLIGKRYVGRANETTIANLSKSRLSMFELPHPPLPQQRAISTVLSSVQRAREQTEQVIGATRELKRSLMRHVFTNGAVRVAPALSASGWPSVELQDVVEPDRPICYGIVQPGPHVPGGVPFVNVWDYADGTIDVTRLKRTSLTIAERYRRSQLRAGDIIVAIRATLGRLAIVPQELDGANITRGSARITPGPDFDRDFVAFYLQSDVVQREFRSLAKGVAIKQVNIADLREVRVPKPVLTQQEEIARILTSVDHKLHSEETRRYALDVLFNSLLNALMAARLRVDDLSSEFA